MSDFAGLLQEFEAVLVEKGLPLNLAMAPGLSQEQIRQAEEETGLVFPTELVTLYSWKNGPDAVKRDYVFGMEIFDGLDLMSLDGALYDHKQGNANELVELALELDEETFLEAGGDWHGLRPDMDKALFARIAIDGMGYDRFADIAADPHVCPVYATFERPYEMSDIPIPLLYRSLYDMFQTTLRCYQEGAFYVIDRETTTPSVEDISLQVGRIHVEMNPGLPYWEDYTRFYEASS